MIVLCNVSYLSEMLMLPKEELFLQEKAFKSHEEQFDCGDLDDLCTPDEEAILCHEIVCGLVSGGMSLPFARLLVSRYQATVEINTMDYVERLKCGTMMN